MEMSSLLNQTKYSFSLGNYRFLEKKAVSKGQNCLCLQPIVQKRIISGLLAGGIKGRGYAHPPFSL